MTMTKLQLERRLRELLTPLSEEDGARIAAEVAERYRPPSKKRSRWRVVEGVELTPPEQPKVSVVERGDESTEVYSDAAPGHAVRAQAVADALNRLEAEDLAPPLAPRG
jgi:hypothetical protein